MANSCVFCNISSGKDAKTVLLHNDDVLVVFRDIRPVSAHHYLVVTKEHIQDAKCLTDVHANLVEQMVKTGIDVVREQGGDVNDLRMGFHWPPFNLIKHLHLHVISSTNQMGLLARGIFWPNSYWFVTADWLLKKFKKETENSPDS